MNFDLIARRSSLAVLVAAGSLIFNVAQAQSPALESKPSDPIFADFQPVKAPVSQSLLLKTGDRLAICGDSITEQKIYSRMIEMYLTVCAPELNVTARQYGWNGETAEGFLARMTNDCLRFQPTIATTCYGMNDHGYTAYQPAIGLRYSNNMTAIVRAFKSSGARVVIGSPGCVGKIPPWGPRGTTNTVKDLNLSLCVFRNIDLQIAAGENVAFADVFWPMFTAGVEAQNRFGSNYSITGRDGVHPPNAGQTMMARSFLKALGFDGEIGVFTVDLKAGSATASKGHKIESCKDGVVTITSHRYPFCAEGPQDSENSIRSAMALAPFNSELNRLTLIVKNASASGYKITWGGDSKIYTAEQLAKGVNLAEDFAVNPFSEPFAKVQAAVQAKENFETHQIKEIFHGQQGRADMEGAVTATEKDHAVLAAAIPAAFVPVKHTIKIEVQ